MLPVPAKSQAPSIPGIAVLETPAVFEIAPVYAPFFGVLAIPGVPQVPAVS